MDFRRSRRIRCRRDRTEAGAISRACPISVLVRRSQPDRNRRSRSPTGRSTTAMSRRAASVSASMRLATPSAIPSRGSMCSALIDAERSRASSRRRSVRQCRRSRFVAIPNSQAFSLPRVESNVGYDSIAARNVSANRSSASSRPTRRAKYAKRLAAGHRVAGP